MTSFEVRRAADDLEPWCRVDAPSAQDAAELWAMREDCASANYAILAGDGEVVSVRDMATGVTSSYSVYGEADPVYFSTKLSGEGE